MAKPQTKTAPTQTESAGFEIEDNLAVPPRSKDIPDYGLSALFGKMKPGQSVLIPFAKVPIEHIRTLVQRFSRDVEKGADPINMVTRTELGGADGKEKIGLRVWRNS